MKMIMAVLIVKAVISMFEKKEKVNAEKNGSNSRVVHPAEFEIR